MNSASFDSAASVAARLQCSGARADITPDHPMPLAGVEGRDGDWQSINRGVALKVLHDHGDAQSFLLRLAPGAKFAAHPHQAEELCVVLEGDVRLGDVDAGPGTYHLALAGSRHHELSSRNGCVLFLRANLDHLAAHS